MQILVKVGQSSIQFDTKNSKIKIETNGDMHHVEIRGVVMKQLKFSDMSGWAIIICRDCGYEDKNVTVAIMTYDETLGGRVVANGYQCQSCGAFAELAGHAPLWGDNTSVACIPCECGGELHCEKPLFCPECRSKSLRGRTTAMT